MTAGGSLVLLIYTVALMAIAAWSAGFCLWPLVTHLRSKDFFVASSRFWFLLGITPLLVGLVVGCASLASAVLKGLAVIPDHCQLHPGHPHLCWAHAQGLFPAGSLFWGTFIAALGLVSFSATRMGRSLFSMCQKLRKAKSVRDPEGFLIVPSQFPTAFVAGIVKPRVYLTTKAFELLNPGERRIVVQHEGEHLRRRDPLRLALLQVVTSLFPGFRWLEEQWRAAVEIECDWVCIENGATADEVSRTILKLARSSPSTVPTLAYAMGSAAVLRRRVEGLLSGVPPCQPSFRWGRVVFAVLILAAVSLSSMHHVLETILGTFVR